MSSLDRQLGVKKESTWNTLSTPVTTFVEIDPSTKIKDEYGRVESSALRVGSVTQREDRFTPYYVGSAGTIQFDVLSKGFAFWLEHMLGYVTTTGPTDSAYTHTGSTHSGATPSNQLAVSFTAQSYDPFATTGGQAFTRGGGKVAKWELSNSVEGNLVCSLDCDFASVDTVTALATASYPASAENLTWAGGIVTIGGSQFDVTECAVSVDNMLKVDRTFVRGNTVKKEQLSTGRKVEWSLKADWDALTQRARVISATRAGALASIVLKWTAPTLIGTTAYPEVTVTIPSARFDEIEIDGSGTDPMTQELSGVGLTPTAGGAPITIAVKTTDATPV